jgi:sulfate/thiosulfate transport system ATP-binding protein
MSITIENVSKRYGGSQWVVDNVSMEVQDGELLVLLGSSGSGKTTILRIIAGLTEPTSGRILLHGLDVTALPPQERGTGFVFQNYSIFGHMSVSENIEFSLRIRKVPEQERRIRCEELLELVGLAGLGGRYADQLSGGQQQRVALARALAHKPKVLLLDEPFGALDVKIRAQLRRSLREIQRRLGVTTILVTHDQEEAFELADRIGVLERGRLIEVGSAEELYCRPSSLFTATFLGAGTLIVGRAEQGEAWFGSLKLPIPPENPHEDGARVVLLFRPEQVVACTDVPAGMPVLGKGSVVEESFAGSFRRVRLRLPHLPGTRQVSPAPAFGEEGLLVDATLGPEAKLVGDPVWAGLSGWTILKKAARRVLLHANFSDPSPLEVACQFAERLQASITALAVPASPEGAGALRKSFETARKRPALRTGQLRIRYGNPAEQIAAELAESIYEMLIVALPPRTGASTARLGRMPGMEVRTRTRQLGGFLNSVLTHADIPVLFVKGEKHKIERMLICTAAGEPGKRDVIEGGRIARRLGASVTLFHASLGPSEGEALLRRHLDRAVASLRAVDIEANARVRQAPNAVSGILEEAVEHDLIVIGSYGPRSRSFLDHNEVMLDVVAGADRSVLVVPADIV